MEINSKNIKLWSTIGPRASLGLNILEQAKNDKDIIAYGVCVIMFLLHFVYV